MFMFFFIMEGIGRVDRMEGGEALERSTPREVRRPLECGERDGKGTLGGKTLWEQSRGLLRIH